MRAEELKLNNKSAGYHALIMRALENGSLLTSIPMRTKALARKRARCFLDADLLACNRTATSGTTDRPRRLSNSYPTSSYSSRTTSTSQSRLLKLTTRSQLLNQRYRDGWHPKELLLSPQPQTHKPRMVVLNAQGV
jgi:hypothetical protein